MWRLSSLMAVLALLLVGCSSSDAQKSACRAATDCAALTNGCESAVCSAGRCKVLPKLKGSVAPEQVEGDCQQLLCDGAGGTYLADDPSDLVQEESLCTVRRCLYGDIEERVRPAGFDCSPSGLGRVCDGRGECVECASHSDCGEGFCEEHACRALSCGDGLLNPPERCDGAALGGATCESLGFMGGVLACAPGCRAFDLTGCISSVCGDSQAQGVEQCDGADLKGESCVSLGFAGGTLGCGTACGFDLGACLVELPPCSPEAEERIYTASALPRAIDDNSVIPTEVTITVQDHGFVESARLLLSASHQRVSDLEFFLLSPEGDMVELSTDNGATGVDYQGTLLSDGAHRSILDGSAPFTGSFLPETPLLAVAGGEASGEWRLRALDDRLGVEGKLTELELQLCILP